MVVTCPQCGKEFPEANAQYNGHIGYHKAHPESVKKEKETPKGSSKSSPPSSSSPPPASSSPPSSGSTSSTTLQPVTFTFSEGERLPSQQEIPEFKSPEQQKEEAKKGGEPTPSATLAEERKAGVSALGALILPLMEMGNNVLSGESIEFDKDKVKFNAKDAEMLAQAIVLVDEKHGGPISKTLGGDSGPEIFLAGVCIGLGVKAAIMIRNRIQRPRPKSAAPSPEEIPRKSPLQEVGDSLRNLVSPKKKEEKKEEAPSDAGIVKLTPDEFMAEAERHRQQSVAP
jgi:hypothetical protein